MKTATNNQQMAAAIIFARLLALAPKSTPAHEDMRSIVACPTEWAFEEAAWAINQAAESTAEWTDDGFEDPTASEAAAACAE